MREDDEAAFLRTNIDLAVERARTREQRRLSPRQPRRRHATCAGAPFTLVRAH